MAVSSQTNFQVLTLDGVSTSFSFTAFVGVSAGSITATLRDANGITQPLSSFTISLNNPATGQIWGVGGTITLPAVFPAGWTLTLERVLPLTQTSTFTNQGLTLPALIESSMDQITMTAQQINQRALRSLAPPAGETLNPLPVSAQRINRFLGFDASGQPVAVSGTTTAPVASLNRFNFSAALGNLTAGQTVFAATYTPGLVLVFVNGLQLFITAFTAADGSTVILNTPVGGSDTVTIQTYNVGTIPTPSTVIRGVRLYADLGIAPNGTQDATTALLSAIALGQSQRIPVVIDGRFLFNSRVVLTTTDYVNIIGNGANNSELLWADGVANPGIQITFSDEIETASLSGLRFLTQGKGTGTAIQITQPTLSSSLWRGPDIQNIAFEGLSPFDDCWNIGIDLLNCWNTRIDNVHMFGRTLTAGEEIIGLVGIRTKNCSETKVTRPNVYGFQTGIDFGSGGVAGAGGGDDEGTILTNFTILSGNIGVKHRTLVAEAGVNIHTGHINVTTTGVDLYAKHAGFVGNLDIYKITGSTATFKAVSAENCNALSISDIIVKDTGTSGACYGVVLEGGSDYNTISRIRAVGPTDAPDGLVVFAGTGNDDNRISEITNFTQPGILFLTAKSNHSQNIFSGVLPSGVEAFVANAATPSVVNAITGVFQTANSSATTITNFAGPVLDGFMFTLLVNDGNTTIQHNAGLILRGGVNATPANGSIFTFRRYGSIWREETRNY